MWAFSMCFEKGTISKMFLLGGNKNHEIHNTQTPKLLFNEEAYDEDKVKYVVFIQAKFRFKVHLKLKRQNEALMAFKKNFYKQKLERICKEIELLNSLQVYEKIQITYKNILLEQRSDGDVF